MLQISKCSLSVYHSVLSLKCVMLALSAYNLSKSLSSSSRLSLHTASSFAPIIIATAIRGQKKEEFFMADFLTCCDNLDFSRFHHLCTFLETHIVTTLTDLFLVRATVHLHSSAICFLRRAGEPASRGEYQTEEHAQLCGKQKVRLFNPL